jgi:hypothetical protein
MAGRSPNETQAKIRSPRVYETRGERPRDQEARDRRKAAGV